MSMLDVLVIGAGPGGYVAAIRAAQNGLSVALAEKNATLGGTCLNVGCIPSKALLESSHLYHDATRLAHRGISINSIKLDLAAMLAHKAQVVEQLTSGIAGLMKRHKVTVHSGLARLVGDGKVSLQGADGEQIIAAKNIVIATGSEPVALPFAPFDGEVVVSSTEALSFGKVPQSLAVIGAGAVGLELGSVWSRLGAEVTVIEMLPQIVPFADKQLAQMLTRTLKAQRLDIRTKTQVKSINTASDGASLTIQDAKGNEDVLSAERVLVAVGRRPNTAGLDLEAAGVAVDEKGRIAVDAERRTSTDGVWAIGDVVDGPMLAHKAEEEGMAVADRIAGKAGHVDYGVIPNVVYTSPELAQVGQTETEAEESGINVTSGKFYFKANGRALSMDAADGLVKVVAEAGSGKLLGVQILGPHASDLIAEAALGISLGATASQLAATCHAHPTLSEALKEAAMAAVGNAIHS